MEGLGASIQALQPPLEHWRRFIYCTSLDGQILGSVNHIQPEDLTSNRSPTTVAHFSQNRLLPLLLENATKAGVALNPLKMPGSGIWMGYECVDLSESGGEVRATISPAGSKLQKTVACEYLVATDGAGSGIRKLMGVELEGEHDMQQLISVHFTSRKLSDYLLKNRPGMLYFVFHPAAVAVIVAHDLRSGEFIAQMPFYPPQQTANDFSDLVCSRILRQLINVDIDVDIRSVKPWIMHAEVAKSFISGESRVILAGDAAHRFPPAGGFGMNTGIQDAHNLAWKLAAVLHKLAPATLLKTYETERKPIAKANTALSVANFKTAMSIPAALGLDPSYAKLVHEGINKSVGNFIPKAFQSAILNGVFSIGRAQVSPLFLNKFNPVAHSRISEVQKILQQGRSLQLQFPAEDLLFRYKTGALISENSEDVDATSERPKDFVALSVPGVRLPHMNIRVLHELDSSSEVCSTLDLIQRWPLCLYLFVSSSRSGLSWASDALRASKSSGVPLRVVIVSDEEQQQGFELDREMIEELKMKNSEFVTEVVASDGGRSWPEVCGVPHSEFVLLVRPDDHIGWRTLKPHDPGSLLELTQALNSIFAKGSV